MSRQQTAPAVLYQAVSLNQCSGALPAGGSAFQPKVFLSDSLLFLFLFSLVLQFNLLAFDNVCYPNASCLLWCSI
jgi:hypothetical protein